jgi:hypothetical protein
MRKLLLVSGLAVATLIPSLASAQSCEQQHGRQVASTLAGAGIGALIGAAVAPRHTGAGAVIGASGGAIVASQASRPDRDCSHAYGYYDRDNQWHANNIDRADARGYYDRDGAWVDGAPDGYYGRDGRWVANSASAYGANASYDGRYFGGRRDIDSRAAWLQQRIDSAVRDGSISRYEARNDRRRLDAIRRDESYLRDGEGRLRPRDEARLQARLDDLSVSLKSSVNGSGY